MHKRTRGFTAASASIAALLLLVGCSAETPEPAATTPVAVATPTVTPTPTPAPNEPAVVPFDGDCALVLTQDQLVDILGDGLIEASPVEDAPSYFATAVRNAGGISCGWTNTETYATVTMTALPADAFPDGTQHEPRTLECEVHHGAQLCSTSLNVENIWLSVRGTDETIVTAALAPIGAVLVGVQAQAATTAADTWIPPICDDLVPPLIDAVGVTPEFGFPSDATPSGIAWDTMVAAGRVSWCGFHAMGGPDKAVNIYMAPGVADLVIPTTAAVEVSGADEAWLNNDTPFQTITVRVGSNILAVTGTSASTTQELVTIAAAVIPTLNATTIVE